MASQTNSDRLFRRISFLLFAILGLLIYSNALRAGFQFDDYAGIVDDPFIRNGFGFRTIWDAFNTRFLLGLSFAVNYAIGRTDPFGFHLFNVILHIFSSFFLYGFIRLIFETPVMKGKIISRNERLVAFFAALIFLTHPVQTQAVTYIWQRSASMATFFYIATLFFYAKSRQSKGLIWSLGSLLACVAAMFTKEITITLPFTIALYEFVFIQDWKSDKKKAALILLPFFLMLPIIPLMLTRSHEVTLEVMRTESGITRFVGENVMKRSWYFLTELNVVRTYFRLFFFPVGQNMDYDYPIAKSLLESGTFFSLIFLIFIFLSAVVILKKFPLISFGVFWIFLTFSVESLVVQSDVIFEHRMYLPMAGFSIAFAAALEVLFKDARRLTVIGLIFAVLFSGATYLRNRIWQNDYTLWQDVIAKSPNKTRGFSNLALAYERDNHYDKAIEYFEKSIERAPHEARERYNLGLVYLKNKDHQKAIEAFRKAIELKPDYDQAYNNLGVEYVVLGRNEEALAVFNKAVEINPRFSGAYKNLGKFYSGRGDRQSATLCYRKAEQADLAGNNSPKTQ